MGKVTSTLHHVEKKRQMGYPKLMTSNPSGVVVLMIQPGRGTIVYRGNHACDVGKYFEFWESESFTDFEGEIILKNE